VPTPIAHGDDDRIVPIAAAARTAIDLVPTATPRVYPGAPHGLTGAYGAYGA
jgi:non-heme chloroperoxidase